MYVGYRHQWWPRHFVAHDAVRERDSVYPSLKQTLPSGYIKSSKRRIQSLSLMLQSLTNKPYWLKFYDIRNNYCDFCDRNWHRAIRRTATNPSGTAGSGRSHLYSRPNRWAFASLRPHLEKVGFQVKVCFIQCNFRYKANLVSRNLRQTGSVDRVNSPTGSI